jgi:hypothetical protein
MNVKIKHKDGTQWIVDGLYTSMKSAENALKELEKLNPNTKFYICVPVGFNPF